MSIGEELVALSELLVTSCGLSSFLLFEVEQDGSEGNNDCTGGESALPCVLVLVSCVTASINFAIDGKIEKASVSVAQNLELKSTSYSCKSVVDSTIFFSAIIFAVIFSDSTIAVIFSDSTKFFPWPSPLVPTAANLSKSA